MPVEIDRVLCLSCGACVGSCPTESITLVDTWIEFDDSCISCGVCVTVCPAAALRLPEKEIGPFKDPKTGEEFVREYPCKDGTPKGGVCE